MLATANLFDRVGTPGGTTMFTYFTAHPKTTWLGVASILGTGATVATSLSNGQAIQWQTVIGGLILGLIGLFAADAQSTAALTAK